MSHTDIKDKYHYDKREVEVFLQELYAIRKPIIEPITSGIMNTSFKIREATGRARLSVLRVYRKSHNRHARILREVALMEILRNVGLPVPEIKKNKQGEQISLFKTASDTYYAAVLAFLPGREIKISDATAIPAVARSHALMHQAVAENIPTVTNEYKSIVQWLESERNVALPKVTNPAVRSQIESLSKNVLSDIQRAKFAIGTLPRGLCHLDYDSDNIFIKGREVLGIVDFDDVAEVPFVLDLGFSLWWWCFYSPVKHRKQILSTYVAEYTKVLPLSETELALLPLFIRLRNATLLNLLFVNLKKQPNTASIHKAIRFDTWLQH